MRVLTAEGGREVSPGDLPPLLARLRDPSCPVTWIHAELHRATVQALDEMGLDEIAVKSLRDGPERPRVEEFADHLYVSLFLADKPVGRRTNGTASPGPGEPGSGLPRLRELRLFLGPKWIISVGHLGDPDYDALAERMKRQVFSRQRGASFVAYHISEWLVEGLQPALERLDDRIDALEDQVVLATGEAPMQELFGLKRDLVDLRRRVAPLRDVMQRLGSHGVLFVEPEAEVYFRDVHDDVMRAIELLDTYRDILSSALDLHLSSVSNRLNRVMKQLTVVATMFMPLSFIVGLFGTNFRQMPFGNLAWFVAMFALMFISVVAMVVYSWRRT
ncbi:MAG: magnesium transporter CorA family protein [bacterium]